jgi:hypothetical protein
MGLFNIFKKKKQPQAATAEIYELLFCDDIDLYRNTNTARSGYPWDAILSASDYAGQLEKIIADDQVASRIKLLAYHRLMKNGTVINRKDLLGVIIEIGLENGLDVLASYRDGTARYINYSGSMIVWETVDERSNALTNDLFLVSQQVVQKTGPWDKPKRPKPAKGTARVTFLVSGDIYFGEGPINVLFNDPLAGPVLAAGATLMKYLVEKAS